MAPASHRRQLVSESAEATEALGERLAALAHPGWVIGLDGELGAGKTCLVRGLARGMGVEGPVSSPTFTLMHAYPGALTLYHLAAWMQERGEAFLGDGGSEWLRADGVALVEWADHLGDWLPADRLRIRLRHLGPERRGIELAWRDGPAEAVRALRELPLPPGITEAP